jgi:hypothetical protein
MSINKKYGTGYHRGGLRQKKLREGRLEGWEGD